jgi:hypothetical protein
MTPLWRGSVWLEAAFSPVCEPSDGRQATLRGGVRSYEVRRLFRISQEANRRCCRGYHADREAPIDHCRSGNNRPGPGGGSSLRSTKAKLSGTSLSKGARPTPGPYRCLPLQGTALRTGPRPASEGGNEELTDGGKRYDRRGAKFSFPREGAGRTKRAETYYDRTPWGRTLTHHACALSLLTY